ncbi:energy transducer TonB family protein [Pararobbsia alpina]|nr:energy transducer TonB [Pararobbsia alpina]
MAAAACVCLLALSGCAEPPAAKAFFKALDLGPSATEERKQIDYKTQVAQRIEEVNAAAITPGHPQAMLRSVVVLTFLIGKSGQILKASVYRTNGDDLAERVAMTSLKRSAPFPPPPKALLNRAGQVELMEAWLFNNDGRFQLQTLASAQKDEAAE